jgi:hypothetical protein
MPHFATCEKRETVSDAAPLAPVMTPPGVSSLDQYRWRRSRKSRVT